MLSRREIITKFISELQKYDSKYDVQLKRDSIYMKTFAVFLFFNKKFMTGYNTTFGNTVYLCDPDFYEKNNHIANPIATLAHEYRHIKDSKKYHILYYIGYLSPAIFSLLIIPMAFIIGWWSLFFLLFLLPIPSIGRTIIEFRGYCMSLFIYYYFKKLENIPNMKDHLMVIARSLQKENFRSSAYYFMWPFDMSAHFEKKIDEIISGDILNSDGVFREIQTALNNTIN